MKNDSTETTEITNLNETETRDPTKLYQ